MQIIQHTFDIIFIGPDGTISNIAAMTTPYSLEPVTSVGPAGSIFETNWELTVGAQRYVPSNARRPAATASGTGV